MRIKTQRQINRQIESLSEKYVENLTEEVEERLWALEDVLTSWRKRKNGVNPFFLIPTV